MNLSIYAINYTKEGMSQVYDTPSWFLSHAARYSERSSDSGQYADGYLKNCFPSVRFHFFEC